MCLSGFCRGDRKPHFPLLIFVMPEAHALWVLPLQLEFGGDVSQALLIFTSNSCKNQVSSWGSKLAQICFKVWPRFSEWLTLTKVHPSSWLERVVGSVVKEQRSPRTTAQGFRTLQKQRLVPSLLSCHPTLRTSSGCPKHCCSTQSPNVGFCRLNTLQRAGMDCWEMGWEEFQQEASLVLGCVQNSME